MEELEDENKQLVQKNKKWISKYEEEIEKNKDKFNALHTQIKQLQDHNTKLEVAARYDTSLQQTTEELSMAKEQLRDKQDLIEQFEAHMTSLAEENSAQINEIQVGNNQLKTRISDLEQQIRERNAELEQAQESIIQRDEQLMQLKMEIEMQ